MHECRDIDAVVANTYRALKPGGVFVISDFPFPYTPAVLQTPPGRFMSGIQSPCRQGVGDRRGARGR
jgi:ubiquinone/menaquinone biosynthesis C-methylase UbiE